MTVVLVVVIAIHDGRVHFILCVIAIRFPRDEEFLLHISPRF